jgi:hypothetical protein
MLCVLSGLSKISLRSRSLVPNWDLINHYCACLTDDFVLGIRASRTTDCTDDRSSVDQWNATSRCNHSIEREQTIEIA